MSKKGFIAVSLFISILMLVGSVSAATISVKDTITGEMLALTNFDGRLPFSASFSNWTVYGLGESKGVSGIGSASQPAMELSTINFNTTAGGGDLELSFFDSGFSAATDLFAQLTGTFNFLAGSIQTELLINGSPHWTTSKILTGESFFDSSLISPSNLIETIELRAKIAHDVTGASTMNFSINAVPIPSAAWLLGAGLIGLVAIRRRTKQ